MGFLNRPAILPVPALGPRMILGKKGSKNLVEGGQFVMPTALEAVHHSFRRADLESTLRHQLGRFLPPTPAETAIADLGESA